MKHLASAAVLLSLAILSLACQPALPGYAATPASMSAESPDISNPSFPVPTVAGQPLPPNPIDPAEAAIYALFLRDADSAVKIIRADTFTDTLPRTDEETSQLIVSNLPGVSSEALENYLHVNSAPSQLPSNMNLGVNYVLISTPEFLDLTSGPDWRDAWMLRFPNSQVGCMAFSRIGFDRAQTQALLYVARLWVDGGYYLMEYDAQNAAWDITARFVNVIAN